MAKKKKATGDKRATKKGPEKTAAQTVREYLKANPQASNKDVIAALAKTGVVIDDYLPSAIRGEAKRAERRKAAKKPAEAAQPAGPPIVVVNTPVYDKFLTDLTSARTHTQVVKNIRILIAKLHRTIEIVEAMKDDDWDIKIVGDQQLRFAARHAMARDAGQARARVQKLGIKPNEVDITT